jgi:putative membrane protein
MYIMQRPGFSWTGLIPFLILVGVVLLIWAIAAHRHDNDDELEHDETALDILKKRYAKGEITKREFVEMKKDIS